MQSVRSVRLAAAGAVLREAEPPAHLDPPESAVEQTKHAEEDAGEPQRVPDGLVVHADGRQVEDEEGRQAQEHEGGDVDVQYMLPKPSLLMFHPNTQQLHAEHRQVRQRHVLPQILEHPADPLW